MDLSQQGQLLTFGHLLSQMLTNFGNKNEGPPNVGRARVQLICSRGWSLHP